jgi:PAS domain S-box-containing protein
MMNGSRHPHSDDAALAFLAGGGVMGELTRAFDWSQTPVGPAAQWPQSLKTIVRTMLDSRYAMWLGWGPDLTFFYNDAYAEMTLGPKHPWALGKPARVVWSEIWADIGPRALSVLGTGKATWDEGLLLFLERRGFKEETYHTFSYSPVPDDSGGIGGMLCVVTEDTERTIGERRLRTLRELAARTNDEARSVEDACHTAARILAGNPKDVPFALLYLLDPAGCRALLAGAAGVEAGRPVSPTAVDLASGDAAWPFRQVVESGKSVVVKGLATRFASLPSGAWPEPPTWAVVLPMAKPGQTQLAGFIVVGVSSRRPLDDAYRGFFDLVSGQVATAVGNAAAYQQERRRAESLAELDRAKTAFFSNVSHEFRTPLTLMLGPIEDMLARPADEVLPGNRTLLEVVHRNGLRLQRLVNTLLDFSRIEAGRSKAVFEPTDLAAFTADLASNFRSACERAGLELKVNCPPLSEPVFVDRQMWEKVVLNLLSNAFKFTFEGGIDVELRIGERGLRMGDRGLRIGDCGLRIEESGIQSEIPNSQSQIPNSQSEIANLQSQIPHPKSAILTVRDTGTGIPPAEMPRLFERFHRIENARGRTHEGSGIGLALVQELVKLHGGSISAESEVGRGTVFHVSIPLGSAHLPREQVQSRQALPAATGGVSAFVEEALRWLPDTKEEGGGREDEGGRIKDEGGAHQPLVHPSSFIPHPSSHRPRVLVADDNADMRQYIVRLLAGQYTVEAVPDGQAALEAVRRQLPDLVLADVMMPRLDGFALLRELRREPRTTSIPVILVSARAGEESRVEGMQAGADDYQVKPFSAQELLARVSAHLQMARLRREASESLRASEERFQLFMDHSPTMAYLKDAEGRYLFVNRTVEQRFDRPRAEWLGKTDFDVFPAAEASRVRQNDQSVLASKRTIQFVETASFPDGQHQFLSIKFPLQDRGDRWLLAGMSIDITEQKQAEEALRRSERELADFFDNATLGLHWVGPEGTILRANRAELEMLGYAPEEYIGHHITEFHADEDVICDILQRLKTGEALRNCEARLRCKDGSLKHVLIDSSVLRENGRFIHTRCFTRDITEHKRAIDAQRRLAAIVESSHDAIMSLDLDGVITSWNAGAERLYGYSAEEIVGQAIAIVIPPDHTDDFPEIIERLRRGEAIDHFETVRLAKDGGRVAVSLTVSPVLDATGKVVGASKIARDITERIRYEQALKDADRRKDEFLATLAHELRNPLAPLRNGLEVMKLARGNTQLVEQSRAMMERQLGQMVRLVDDLLDVSRISRGKITLHRQRVELAAVVQQAVETSRPLIDASEHELAISVPREPIYVNADVTRLAQVFANLLNNAAKYTERGGRISLSIERQGSDAVVSVQDNGVGIPPPMLPNLFEMFTQVDRSLERSQGGLGIGLSIVKRLTEMHGGTVEAHSAGYGQGSEFVVRLPVVLSLAVERRNDGAAMNSAAVARRRVLVVDDNRDAAASLAMMLKLLGNETQTAHDGLEALEVAAALRPDVIFLDIGMPRLNGYETARRIREEPWGQSPLLIALTGWGQEDDRRRSREAGFDAHLTKPIDPQALEKLLAARHSNIA